MRNQKGVSLITLVITIIVVIILAAIALGGGAADTAGQAQFSGFATEMGGLKESVQTAMTTAKGEEAIRGNNRSFAQLYNYVARGGRYAADFSDASGDSAWLTQSDANTIPCTLIEKTYAKEVFGASLPVRKVETYYGTNQEVSYYVTPQGQVFCWPPYTYDSKSYVTNSVTVKDGSGDEIDGTNATKQGEYEIYFEETGERVGVIVSASDVTPSVAVKNLTGSQNTVKGTALTGNKDVYVGVWYSEKDATKTDNTRGVARGIDYSSYDNTAVVE